MPLKLGFFFDGASRYIPLRVSIAMFALSLVWILISTKKIISERFMLGSSIYTFVSTSFIFLWVINDNGNVDLVKYLIGFIFPGVIILNLYVAYKLLNESQLSCAIKIYVISSLLIVTIDTFVRIVFPDYAFKGEFEEFNAELARDSFYIFKYGSIMYLDSNYVALHILVIMLLSETFSNRRVRTVIFLYSLVLLILTFSRSAYIGAFLFYFSSYIYYKKLPVKTIVLFFFGVATLYLIYYFSHNSFSTNDISLSSKFEIFKSLALISTYEPLVVLFGIGFEVGGYLYSFREGAYAHALLTLLLGEVGVIGCIIYGLTFTYLISFNSREINGILLTMLICGMSLVYPWDSIYIYSIFILLFKTRLKAKENA